jgi:ribose transport system ATP-binding protein
MTTDLHKHDVPALAVEGITKAFGPNKVLFGVDFDVHPGEVHALLGENGAGKSTLVKILSGYLQPTNGQINVSGRQVELENSSQGEDLGIVLIHQEFNLAEQLTAEENIFLGRELFVGWFLDGRTMRLRSRELLQGLQCDVNPGARVKDLSVSDKQMVEIAKAISRDARILIMDEPTAVLTNREVDVLFRLIRELKQNGVAIVYISHKLDEIQAIADRVTILRDGHLITTELTGNLTPDDMARLMVGRELNDMFPDRAALPSDSEVVLEADGLTVPSQVKHASFQLHKGEVLGFAGLVGAGRTALMEAIVGLREKTAGRVLHCGREVKIRHLADASKLRIAYLTKDRKGNGLLMQTQLRPNLTLLALDRFTNILIDEERETEALNKAVREFDIRVADTSATAGTLSGGNQQKLLLAKIMQIEPDIIIIDEPTRGIDVGTKQQIYSFIDALTKRGKSLILISSEMQEIIGLCDRVVVMRSGHVAGTLSGDEIEEHEIMRYATGLKGMESDDRISA